MWNKKGFESLPSDFIIGKSNSGTGSAMNLVAKELKDEKRSLAPLIKQWKNYASRFVRSTNFLSGKFNFF